MTEQTPRRPRVTYVTMAAPRPARNGYCVRIQTIGQAMAQHADVRFLVLSRDADPAGEVATRERFAADFVSAPDRSKLQKGAVHLRAALANRNRWMEKYQRGPLLDAARAALDAHRPDIVVLGSLSLYVLRASFGLDDAQIVLDHHNVETVNYDRMARVRRWPGKLFPLVDARAFARLEREAAAVDEHWAVSDDDRDILARNIGRPVVTVPNVAQDWAFAVDPKGTRSDAAPVIGFMADYGYYPNVGAAFDLFRVVAHLKAQGVACEAVAMGRHPTEAMAEEAARVGVALPGFVDDPVALLERFTVLVAPIRSGGGTKLKIIEALAMGIPVVTTPIGSEGIPVLAEDLGLVAESNEDLAAAVRTLLADRERLAAMSRRAKAWAERSVSTGVLVPLLGERIAACMRRIAAT